MDKEYTSKQYTKITIYIRDCHFNDENITDEKQIAQLIKDHIAHLGESTIYYERRYKSLSWWQKLLKSLG